MIQKVFSVYVKKILIMNKNISILSKIECKGGNEWRIGEYIIEFYKKGYNINIYCHKNFNDTVKKYICKKIGKTWTQNIYENMKFKINCRPNEKLIISPVDELSFGNPLFINDLLINKNNISKLIININWYRKDLKKLQLIIDNNKIIYLCANREIQKFYKFKTNFITEYLPSPISKDFSKIKIDYDNIIIGRHSRSFNYKFSSTYINIIKDNPNYKFLIMGLDLQNEQHINKYSNINIFPEFKITALNFLQKIGIFMQINRKDYIEMSPRVVEEAMMAGLPVIAENKNGTKDQIIHQKTGLLIDQNNIKKINKYLYKLINNKKYRQQLGKNAKKYALKHFSSDIIVNKLEKLING